ncbi:MAG: PKD domain-containing protein [Bacteroidales bacterium]|nr:PKD domain-containing protein [Bacteroidales bacterium]
MAFQNNTTDGSSYLWDFGDGSVSTEISPQHQYEHPGEYTVSLRANSSNGNRSADVSRTILVNRWILTGIDFSFNPSGGKWGDSTGCFETGCDTLNAIIYFYTGNKPDYVYATPIMSLGAKSLKSASISIDTTIAFTNEEWKITFVHEYKSGAGTKFSEYSFNPVTTLDNGVENNMWSHYIGYGTGDFGIRPSALF